MNHTLSGIICAALALLTLSSCSNSTKQTPEGITSPAIRTIMARRSIRSYKSNPVSRDTLDVILNCGINSANAMNRQSWEIRVVDNASLIDSVTRAFLRVNPKMANTPGFVNMFRNAPAVIFIANETASGMSQIDCGLLGGNIMIAATSLGLGTCCLGGPIAFLKSDEGKFFLDKLAFSEGYELLYAIAIGYPAESLEAKPRKSSKISYVL